MKVLFLHPEDDPWHGEWAGQRWDLIVDQGYASSFAYEEWSRRLGARALSIFQFAGQTEGYRWVNHVIESGRGRLLDRMGVDWWEMLAMESHQALHLLYLFNQLRAELIGDRIELAASRPHLFTRILEQTSGKSVFYFQGTSRSLLSRAGRMLRSARKLRSAQMIEIAFDKWDAGYRLRRYFTKHKRARLAQPAVLMPSAYSNVTRSALAYVERLPHRQFLLTTTRRNALLDRLPGNVAVTPLAAYVLPFSAVRVEAAELQKAWEVFQRTMRSDVEEFRHASYTGLWDYFPVHLEHGLRLREAWKHLLDCEPITGVLCGDDLNYHTRLPLILAHLSDRNAVYCSHGALDGGFLFKMPLADCFLVKGEMERDYLQSVRAVDTQKILLGAPGRNTFVDQENRRSGAVVFFSQPYEVEGGRVDEIYRELLPHLSSVARGSGHRLIIKLHPFESKRARRALAASILPADVCNQVEIVGDVPPEEVIARTWCGVAVDSSVAVECALRRVPFFLCGWLDFGGMGYLRQFARFGVGQVLTTPESLEQIPAMVANYRAEPAALARLWHEADPAQLDEVLFGRRQMRFQDPCVY
jgi:hypothetical protein